MRFDSRLRLAALAPSLAATLSLGACSGDSLTRIEPVDASLTQSMVESDGQLAAFPILEAQLPAVPVAPKQIAPELLESEIANARGRALIGLKSISARRAADAGVIAATTRSEALAARGMLSATGVQILRTYRYSNTVVAQLAPGEATRLLTMPFVDYIEADAPVYLQALAAGQDTSWGTHLLRIKEAWEGTFGPPTQGQYVNITILDSGLDYTHRFFGDGPENLGADCLYVEGTGNCYDYGWGHGAHVGGIIAARNNAFGWIGIAHDPGQFASVRVCTDTPIGPECLASNVAAGLEWAIASGRPRHIVNMSIGLCKYSATLHSKVQQAAASGILMIASVGNAWAGQNGCPGDPPGATGVMYPARWPEVMGVSGVLAGDTFAEPVAPPAGGTQNPYTPGGDCGVGDVCASPPDPCIGSRSGTQVEIAAPHWAVSMKSNGGYGALCGTSMASAAVSGVAALLWSRNSTWSAQQVRDRLKATAVALGQPAKFGSGRVDPINAIYSCAPPSPLSAVVTGSYELSQPGWHVWNAIVSGGACPSGYPYQSSWGYSESETGPFVSIGTSSHVGRYVDENSAAEFWLSLTVSTLNEQVSTQVHVVNSVSNPCGPLACLISQPVPNAPRKQ